MSIYDRNVEFESRTGFSRGGLPDEFFLTPSEYDVDYRRHMLGIRPADWHDVPCAGCGAAILLPPDVPALCRRCERDDDRTPPTPGALFPEVSTWTDAQLIVAIELCERRDSGLNLHAVGNRPDRHEAFLDAVSAELVKRLEARGVTFGDDDDDAAGALAFAA